MGKALTHLEYQAQVLLPAYIRATRVVTEPMTGQKAWDILQAVNNVNAFKPPVFRQGIYQKENSNFLYWARVYVREVYGERVHLELDQIFWEKGYHRLRVDEPTQKN